jgi:hypothetical protein
MDKGGPDWVLETEYNAVTRRLAAEKGLPLVDLHRCFCRAKDPMQLLVKDGIHLTPEAYKLIGAHWPLGAEMDRQAIVRNYNRQNMFLATHPQVTIVAHPWWWRTDFHTPGGSIEFRWLEDFSIIPESMHDEFAAAVREHGKIVEINTTMTMPKSYSEPWCERYRDYLAYLREAGCRFSIGGDSHAASYDRPPQAMGDVLERRGFSQGDLWTGPSAP